MPDRNADPEEFRRAIAGVDWPASKEALLNKAKDHGGLDAEVPHVLGQLPDRAYESPADLDREVERVYAHGGGYEDVDEPAAPPAGRQPDPAVNAPLAPAPVTRTGGRADDRDEQQSPASA